MRFVLPHTYVRIEHSFDKYYDKGDILLSVVG